MSRYMNNALDLFMLLVLSHDIGLRTSFSTNYMREFISLH